MKILICDRFNKDGKSPADWKEGWEFYYAFNDLGVQCDIAGANCPILDIDIPKIQNKYDFMLVTENYYNQPNGGPWKWWNWEEIKTPKMFWAIDTHLVDYRAWISKSQFDYVGLNNKCDIEKYSSFNSFYFPYGVSKKHYGITNLNKKEYDISFIGQKTQDRQSYIKKYNIVSIEAYGSDYVNEIQKSKICFNKSISYDLNAKMLELIAAGSFMLSNFNQSFYDLTKENINVEKMLWKDDRELEEKLSYFLKNEEEREYIASDVRQYILANHGYENRAKFILDKIQT